jgi:TolA-binding protein
MNRLQVVVAVLMVGLTVPVAAQRGAVNDAAEIERLRDTAYLVERDLTALNQRDTPRAGQLHLRLEELQEEIVYLKVKQRKQGDVQRREYADLRDRLEDLRAEARPVATTSTGRAAPRTDAPAAPVQNVLEVPVGTEMDVRLTDSLDSGKAMVEDRLEATTLADVHVGGRVAIPAGSVVRGVVTAVDPATRTNRTARMTVSFDQVTVNGQAHPIRGTVTEAIQGSGMKGEVGRVGVGAGAGALIGGLLGGVKGALVGVAIGGAGTLAATEGKEVRLPQGSVLRVRLDSPVQMYAAR